MQVEKKRLAGQASKAFCGFRTTGFTGTAPEAGATSRAGRAAKRLTRPGRAGHPWRHAIAFGKPGPAIPGRSLIALRSGASVAISP